MTLIFQNDFAKIVETIKKNDFDNKKFSVSIDEKTAQSMKFPYFLGNFYIDNKESKSSILFSSTAFSLNVYIFKTPQKELKEYFNSLSMMPDNNSKKFLDQIRKVAVKKRPWIDFGSENAILNEYKATQGLSDFSSLMGFSPDLMVKISYNEIFKKHSSKISLFPLGEKEFFLKNFFSDFLEGQKIFEKPFIDFFENKKERIHLAKLQFDRIYSFLNRQKDSPEYVFNDLDNQIEVIHLEGWPDARALCVGSQNRDNLWVMDDNELSCIDLRGSFDEYIENSFYIDEKDKRETAREFFAYYAPDMPPFHRYSKDTAIKFLKKDFDPIVAEIAFDQIVEKSDSCFLYALSDLDFASRVVSTDMGVADLVVNKDNVDESSVDYVVAVAKNNYPNIYPCRAEVLHHIFWGYGTGYSFNANGCIQTVNSADGNIIVKPEKRDDYIPFRLAPRLNCEYEKGNALCKRLRTVPSENHSLIFNLPDNISDDWLDAAFESVRDIKDWLKNVRETENKELKRNYIEIEKKLSMIEDQMSRFGDKTPTRRGLVC
jgi:hypothetical protein